MWTKYASPMRAPEDGGGSGSGAGAGDKGNQGGSAGGTGGEPWHKGVEPELIGHWQNKQWDIKDPKTVAVEATKQALAAQKLVGVPPEQIIRLPAKPDDEAGWKGVYARLGVPGEAKDYDFTGIKRADGSDPDAGLTDAMRAALLNARVPKDRAPDVVKAVLKRLDDVEAEKKTVDAGKLAAERAELDKNWGQNKEFNLMKAMEGARRLGIDPESVKLLEGQVGYSKVMEAMRRIGVGTSEDTWKDGGPRNPQAPMTREAAMARRSELMHDPQWTARYSGGGTVEMREMMSLNVLISGEGAEFVARRTGQAA